MGKQRRLSYCCSKVDDDDITQELGHNIKTIIYKVEIKFRGLCYSVPHEHSYAQSTIAPGTEAFIELKSDFMGFTFGFFSILLYNSDLSHYLAFPSFVGFCIYLLSVSQCLLYNHSSGHTTMAFGAS